jgi:hypothetical protein
MWCMTAEQFKMVQYFDIVTKNIICVILRENQHQHTLKKLKRVSLVLLCKALAHKPSQLFTSLVNWWIFSKWPCSAAVLGYLSVLWTPSQARPYWWLHAASNIDWIRFLLGTAVDSNGKTINPDFPPIIFEDNNSAMARGLFQNDILFKIVFHFYLTLTKYS